MLPLPLFQVEAVLLLSTYHSYSMVDLEIDTFGDILQSFVFLPKFIERIISLFR